MAADSAVVDYDVDNSETPILSLEEAVERSSFFEVPSSLYPSEVGDLSKGMSEADKKILSARVLHFRYLFIVFFTSSIVANSKISLTVDLFFEPRSINCHICRLNWDHSTTFIWRIRLH